MELRQLRYLDAVARRRSFTRAASELHVAQSAVSQQVGRLERELGVELLRRTTRRVEVTEAGDLVLVRARRALAEADGVRADLDALRGLVRGTLRLGGVPPIGPTHPAALIAEFTRAHPGVAVTVNEDVAFALLGQLREGGLDLVIALLDPGPLDGSMASGSTRRSSSSSPPSTIRSRERGAYSSSASPTSGSSPTAPDRRCGTPSSRSFRGSHRRGGQRSGHRA
jgi:DNA-binding transcriptional LysR family regulator